MVDRSSRGRAALMTLVVVAAFAVGAGAVYLSTRPSAPPTEQPAVLPLVQPVVQPAPHDALAALEQSNEELRRSLDELRASYDKLAKSQKDLQSRLEHLNEDLDKVRGEIRASEPASADPALPRDACVVQAVDNKNDIYVIANG